MKEILLKKSWTWDQENNWRSLTDNLDLRLNQMLRKLLIRSIRIILWIQSATRKHFPPTWWKKAPKVISNGIYNMFKNETAPPLKRILVKKVTHNHVYSNQLLRMKLWILTEIKSARFRRRLSWSRNICCRIIMIKRFSRLLWSMVLDLYVLQDRPKTKPKSIQKY